MAKQESKMMILAGFLFNGRFYKSLGELRGRTVSDENEPIPMYIKSGSEEKASYFDIQTKKYEFKTALTLLRELADLQNGPPLVKEEDEWNDAMTSVYDFLEQHEQ